MKRIEHRKTLAAVALLITFIFCIPFYQTSLYQGLDVTFHLSRIDGLLSCTKDLQIPWAIYAEKNFGFGYASPLFYCDLFLFPAAVLYAMNTPIVIVYKIFVFVVAWFGVFFSLLSMYYFTKDKWLTVFGGLLFAFSSYHINDFFIRAAIGEAMAFSLMPLFPLVTYRYFAERKNNTLELAMFFTLLALAHLITFALCAAITAILFICYIGTMFKKKGHFFTFVKAVIIGFALSAFFLVPLLQQLRSQTFLFAQNRELFGETIMQMYSNTPLSAVTDYLLEGGYDLEAHHYFVGLAVLFAPFLYLFTKDRGKTHVYMGLLTLFSMVLFLCTTDLIPLWKISILQSIQFTYRFNILIASFLPFVLVYTLKCMNRKSALVISVLLTVYLAANTGVIYRQLMKDSPRISDTISKYTLFGGQFYENYNNHYNIAELGSGEYLPATHKMDYQEKQGSVFLFETIAPSVSYSREGTTSTLKLNSLNDGFVAIPVTWYLGYQAERQEGDSWVVIPITQEEYTGQIVIPVIAGEHTYRVRYVGTKVQKAALALSFVSLLILAGFLMARSAARKELENSRAK